VVGGAATGFAIPIVLEPFTADDPRYATYRRIKYAVFMAEQGWAARPSELAAQMADPDPCDRWGGFWLARTEAGAAAGVIRGMAVSAAFPHRDLFDHHLGAGAVRRLAPALGTVNALAVVPPYRGCEVTVTGNRWRGGVGSVLLLASLRSLEEAGVRAVLATVQGPVSAHLFLRLGFLALDAPCMTALQPSLPLMNVGLLLGSPAHRAAEEKRGLGRRAARRDADSAALLGYFEGRHRHVIGRQSLDDRFRTIARATGPGRD
jgi:hypothetical protein